MQTRRGSAAEALTNTLVGYLIGVATNAVVLPWFGVHISVRDDFAMAAIFTVVSLVRSYALRRVFTHLTERRTHEP